MRKKNRFLFKILLCIIIVAVLTACGYQFQRLKNPFKGVGIEKIFITNFKNDTYLPGIERLFSSAMSREISKSGVFTLVNNREEADAVLRGYITAINRGNDGAASPIILSKDVVKEGKQETEITRKTVTIAYKSSITGYIEIFDNYGKKIYSAPFNGNRQHPGSVVIENDRLEQTSNSTASLGDESEQRLAYAAIAQQAMSNSFQKIVDLF